MKFYGKIGHHGEEYLFEGDDHAFIDEGSGGTALGRAFVNGGWQQWQISGRPMPDVMELSERDKTKWAHLLPDGAEFFESPWGQGGDPS